MEFQSAKEIYTHFLGSHFHMSREGAYDQYKSFGIPEEKEMEWRQELIKAKLSELTNVNILWVFPHMYAHEAIPELLRYTVHGDGFYQCRLAETLFDIVTSVLMHSMKGANKAMLKKAEMAAKKIWKDLIKDPKQETVTINEIGEAIDNEYIRTRARTNLERYEEMSGMLENYRTSQ